jgi:hypothetical protein
MNECICWRGSGLKHLYNIYLERCIHPCSWFPDFQWQHEVVTWWQFDQSDDSIFSSADLVAYWEWLEKGSFRWPGASLIQDGRQAAILDFVSVDYLTNAWVDCSDFFVAYWGVTGGRFLSMTSAAAHSRWPPWQPSWFGFHRFSDERPSRLVRYFCGLLGVTGGRFLSMTSATAHSRWLPYLSMVTEGKLLN